MSYEIITVYELYSADSLGIFKFSKGFFENLEDVKATQGWREYIRSFAAIKIVERIGNGLDLETKVFILADKEARSVELL